jgi:hypothetical protein
MVRDAGHGLLDAGMSYARGDVRGIISAGTSLVKMLSRTKEDRERTRIAKTSPADVIQLSGCKDYQTSSDTTEAVYPDERLISGTSDWGHELGIY